MSSTVPVATAAQIISIELYDNSSFKLSMTAATTPKDLIANISKKAGLAQVELFGLQCQRSLMVQSESFGKRQTPTTAPPDNEERVFLQDDIPILDQASIVNRGKTWLAMKYAFVNAKAELDDAKTIALLCHEMSYRLKYQTEPLAKNVLVDLIALQIHSKMISSAPGPSHMEDVRSFAPKTSLTNEADFFDETLNTTKALTGMSYKDACCKFLMLMKSNFPQYFQTKFDATHVEFSAGMSVTVSSSGLKIQHNTVDKTVQPLILPFRTLGRWTMNSLDDDGSSATGFNDAGFKVVDVESSAAVNAARGSMISNNSGEGLKTAMNAMNGSMTSLAYDNNTKLAKGTIGKNSKFSISKKSISTRTDTDFSVDAKDKTHRYVLTLQLSENYWNSIDLIVLSTYANDFRLVELISRYSIPDRQVASEPVDTNILDDPNLHENTLTCIAKNDYHAKTEDELMFLKDEEITILKKLGNDLYIGSCQSIKGKFYGSQVHFRRRETTSDTITRSKSSTGREGEVYNIFMVDDTRRSHLVTDSTTPQDLVQQLVEKLELTDYDFFAIFEVAENFERCLRPAVPIVRQGITASSKLVFKTRILYKDVAELNDPMTAYLYYLQVKEFVISGVCPITETDVVDFVSLQLQATLGDHDENRHKASSIGAFSTLLPPQYQKMSLTRNETWWHRKFLTAHMQHRGISKTDAEKAYISLAQKLPLFGFQVFTPMQPDNIIVGINRDYVVILDRATKVQLEKYSCDIATVKWKNQSLVAELSMHTAEPDKIYRLFTAQALDLIEIMWLLSSAEIRNELRKKCKGIREKFSILGVSLEFDNTDDKKIANDPELFAATLHNGVALQNLIPALSKPFSATEQATDSTNPSTTVTNASIVPDLLSLEKIRQFLKQCRDVHGMNEYDLFTPEQLRNYSLENFGKVILCLQKLFGQGEIGSKMQQIQEHMKANKMRSKGASSAASGAPPAMTTEDFMRKVMEELFATETNYVKDLESIVTLYVKPVQVRLKLVTTLTTKSPEEEVLDLFNNMDDIYHFHANMYERLKNIAGDITKIADLGNLFDELGERFIPLYEQYCSGHSDSSDRLPDMKNSPELMAILGLNGDPQNDQVAKRNLSSQLIKPVQRIMRYHLLLKELQRYTPENHSGYVALEKALTRMKDVALAVNEIKRKKENQATLTDFAARIEGYDGVPILSYGNLLQDGKMLMIDKSFMLSKSKFGTTKNDYNMNFFLFEEVLMFCKENKKQRASGYKYKGIIPTACLTTSPTVNDIGNTDDMKFAWELTRTDQSKTYIMTSLTQEEKDRWLSTINGCAKRAASRPPGERAVSETDVKKDESVGRAKSYSLSSAFRMSGISKKKDNEKDEPFSPNTPLINETGGVSPMPSINGSLGRSFTMPTTETGKPLSLQDQVAALTKQCTDMQAMIKSLGHENAILASKFDKEQKLSKKLEVDAAVQQGRNDALEMILAGSASESPQKSVEKYHRQISTSSPNVSEAAQPEKSSGNANNWSVKDKAKLFAQMESDNTIKADLSEQLKSLNAMLLTMPKSSNAATM